MTAICSALTAARGPNPIRCTRQAMSGDPLAAFTGRQPERHPRYKLSVVVCAGCAKESLFVRKWDYDRGGGDGDPDGVTEWHRRLYPIGRATKSLPNTSEAHLKPYHEACAVLELSPAASACMSRRCLQGILKEQGYSQKNLVQQIEAVLSAETLPPLKDCHAVPSQTLRISPLVS
jgi:hypothetical protein